MSITPSNTSNTISKSITKSPPWTLATLGHMLENDHFGGNTLLSIRNDNLAFWTVNSNKAKTCKVQTSPNDISARSLSAATATHDTCKHIELLHYTSLKLSTILSDGEVVGGVAIADASLTILPRHVKLIQGLIKKRKTSKSGLTWPSSSPPFPQYWPSLCLYQTIPDTHTSLEKVWQEKTLTKE